jgi:multiple sugar transport system substrate-binding protein
LAHWLDFSADRWLPPMPALLQSPFWLDPLDPHRMTAAIQTLTQPHGYYESYPALSGNWRHKRVVTERVWAIAVHRVAVDSVSPEQATDDAIARIKQILNE